MVAYTCLFASIGNATERTSRPPDLPFPLREQMDQDLRAEAST